jgi:hypothetical protein
MNPRICICCGEPINLQGNVLSRNPNICASCSSMADGMEDLGLPGLEAAPPGSYLTPEAPMPDTVRAGRDEKDFESAVHGVVGGA